MDSTDILVRQIAEACARGGPARRHAILTDLTDLFLARAPRLSEEGVGAFDAAMLALAREAAQEARAGLSQRLALLRNAPRGTVRDLAYDLLPVVAAPVLEHSSRLSLADLAAIAREHPQDHLLALARRSALPPPLAEIVALRGDPRVARALAQNPGAQLTARARAALAARAGGDADLQDSLRARPDLSAQERAGLASLVQDRVRLALDRDLGAAAAQALAAPDGEQARLLAEAEAAVAERAENGLEEGAVVEWLARRQVLHALAGIAHRAGIPTTTALAAHRAEAYESTLFLVRAAGLSWRTLKLVLAAPPRRPPPAHVLESAFQTFQSVPVETAQRVARAAGRHDAAHVAEAPPRAIKRTA